MLGADAAARAVASMRAAGVDPSVAERFADDAADILALTPGASAWEETLACEPGPWLTLEGEAIDRALGAIGDFADLASPYLIGHSAGVAALAARAARRCGLDAPPSSRFAVRRCCTTSGASPCPSTIWHKPGPLTPDEWEQVRLHAYHSERVLLRSPALAPLARRRRRPPRAARRVGLSPRRGRRPRSAGRALLAAADAYHAMTEPRPHRAALPAARPPRRSASEARAGRLDADAVAAVLEAARPAGSGGSSARRA